MINKLYHAVLLLIIASMASTMLLFAQIAFAQDSGTAPPNRSETGNSVLNFLDNTAERGGLKNPGEDVSGEDATLKMIGNIINAVLGIVGIIFFILLFWSGIRWMTAGGNEETINSSKSTIKTSVIGIAVIFSAFVITNFVLNQIDKTTGSQAETTELGMCRYPESEECELESSDWTLNQDNVTRDYCSTSALIMCSDPDLYEWAPN